MACDSADPADRRGRQGGPLVDSFHIFFSAHRFCGALKTGIDGSLDEATTVWMSCSCGGHVEETAPHGYRPDSSQGLGDEITSLDAFYLEHRRCGELNTGIERTEKR